MGLAFNEDFNDGMAAFNTVIRITIFVNSVLLGQTMGFLPAGSYAYAAKNYRRWFRLVFHCSWICFAWGSLTAVLTWTIPREISSLFASGKGYLDICTPMLKYSNALGFIAGGRFCCMTYLQSLQKGILSTVMSLFSNFIAIIVFAYVLYFTNKHDGVRLIWCCTIAYAFGMVLGILFLIHPFYVIRRDMKEQDKAAGDATHQINLIDKTGSTIYYTENDQAANQNDQKEKNEEK